jgi:hypothetical protein
MVDEEIFCLSSQQGLLWVNGVVWRGRIPSVWTCVAARHRLLVSKDCCVAGALWWREQCGGGSSVAGEAASLVIKSGTVLALHFLYTMIPL